MAGTVKELELSTLVLDYNLYPRDKVDQVNVGDLARARESGAELPPIIVDAQSRRIVDGVHRYEMYRRAKVGRVLCELRRYESDQEMFLDAVRLNAAHGHRLGRRDQARVVALCRELGIPDREIAASLSVPEHRVTVLQARVIFGQDGAWKPSKRGFKHLYGQTLTPTQVEVHSQVRSGEAGRAARELAGLIREDMVDWSHEPTVAALHELQGVLSAALARVAVAVPA